MVKILEYRWMEGGLGIIDMGATPTPANRHTTAVTHVAIRAKCRFMEGATACELGGKKVYNIQHTLHQTIRGFMMKQTIPSYRSVLRVTYRIL